MKCKHVVGFDRYLLPLGKFGKDNKFSKSKELRGEIVQTTYSIPANHSILEIFENYREALENAGFEILFELDKKEEPSWSRWTDMFVRATSRNSRCEQEIKYSLHYADEGHFVAAKLTSTEGDFYVAICMAKGNWHNYTTLQQDIIHIKPMNRGLVKITSEIMEQKLNQVGHVALYGIYFDFNKATLKPESEPVLKEIAQLLKTNPGLKLYVVGHTDNVGPLDYNMKLSKARATAVVKRLVAKYGISPDRLKPFGVGPLCPVASNSTEQGRAKNRRVELVAQ